MTMVRDDEGVVPEWDLADRMRKSLRVSGIRVQEIADYMGVTRTAVGNWINGRNHPSMQTIRLWAMRCGVPFEWLRDGIVNVGPDGWAPRGSNPQPTDYKLAPSAQVIRFPELRRLAATA